MIMLTSPYKRELGTTEGGVTIERVKLLEKAGKLDAPTLMAHVLEVSDSDSLHEYDEWTHKLVRDSRLDIGELLMEFIRRFVIEGNIDNLPANVRVFVEAVFNIPALQEICVVNELGFPDVWLIFHDLT
ncbi:MAG: hypothetical protein LBR72_06030, partial [Oscillospiraceae bacterium]|nr:hypothetical protein [Oscillospiraceae bacterium]